jgi:hypothetical protein
MSAANPYMPPNSFVADVSGADSHAEAIRQEHIAQESNVRGIGLLYYVGGTLLLVLSLGFIALFFVPDANEVAGFVTAIGVVYFVFGIVSLLLGHGLRRMAGWARITGIVFSCIGLLGFPLGTLMNGYFLYVLFSEKGRRVFEPDYADIVAATPHIKPHTSLIVWLFIGLISLAIIGIVAAIVLPSLSR